MKKTITLVLFTFLLVTGCSKKEDEVFKLEGTVYTATDEGILYKFSFLKNAKFDFTRSDRDGVNKGTYLLEGKTVFLRMDNSEEEPVNGTLSNNNKTLRVEGFVFTFTRKN